MHSVLVTCFSNMDRITEFAVFTSSLHCDSSWPCFYWWHVLYCCNIWEYKTLPQHRTTCPSHRLVLVFATRWCQVLTLFFASDGSTVKSTKRRGIWMNDRRDRKFVMMVMFLTLWRSSCFIIKNLKFVTEQPLLERHNFILEIYWKLTPQCKNW